MTATIHGYPVADIRKAAFPTLYAKPGLTCLPCERRGDDLYAGFGCWCVPAEVVPDVPAWVIRVWISQRLYRTHAPRTPRTAFRHNHATRVAPKRVEPLVTRTDGCGKAKRRRRSERSQYPCTRKEAALVARPVRDEHEHIAEELMHARELADLEAITSDHWDWDDDYHWAEGEWRDYVNGYHVYEMPVWQVADEAAEAAFSELDALMREAPLGAPVHMRA